MIFKRSNLDGVRFDTFYFGPVWLTIWLGWPWLRLAFRCRDNIVRRPIEVIRWRFGSFQRQR